MVAAWIRADTGVGPAMASGSQVWRGNWALLPITAHMRANAPQNSSVWSILPLSAWELSDCQLNVSWAAKYRMLMPTSRPTSPVRVVKNAFSAASELALSSHQWPISMNEHRPIASQPNRPCRVDEAVTSTYMPHVNRLKAAKK